MKQKNATYHTFGDVQETSKRKTKRKRTSQNPSSQVKGYKALGRHKCKMQGLWKTSIQLFATCRGSKWAGLARLLWKTFPHSTKKGPVGSVLFKTNGLPMEWLDELPSQTFLCRMQCIYIKSRAPLADLILKFWPEIVFAKCNASLSSKVLLQINFHLQ